ncbi:MAG: helix-turn-helix transcriptional regulator [Sandaracinaceae bacterium]|nr:helix-turn-helix transcriptional regulator [Sandaracinaceae bacterium]
MTCFDELGWSATTIADIRERSGASTGSIYHHFGDKEGIAAALYAETLRSYREALGERLDRTRTAKGLVRALVLHHIEWSVEHRTERALPPRDARERGVRQTETVSRASTRAFLEEMFARLKGYVEAGEILELPHVLYTPLIIGPAQDVVRHWLRGRIDRDIRTLARPLADAAWRALRAE